MTVTTGRHRAPAEGCSRSPRWPLERVLFALAGTVTLLSAALAATVSIWFLLLTAFVGVNQWLYVTVRACPASLVIKRAFGLRSAIYGKPR
jgi:fatty acid desaturase